MTKQEVIDEARAMAAEHYAGCDELMLEAAMGAGISYVFLRAVAEDRVKDPKALAIDLVAWLGDRAKTIDIDKLDSVMAHQRTFVADDEVKH